MAMNPFRIKRGRVFVDDGIAAAIGRIVVLDDWVWVDDDEGGVMMFPREAVRLIDTLTPKKEKR